MAQKKASLKVIAAHLGITQSTVSRALNGYEDISEKTRTRVERAAQELGYKPNLTARRLSIGMSETVCYLMPREPNGASQAFVSRLVQGLSDTLSKRNWDLLITNDDSTKNELCLIDRLYGSGRASGFVISRPTRDDPRVRLLQEIGCPFVVHGRTGNSADYAWFDVDGKTALSEAVDHLASLGHTKIAFIGSLHQYQFSHDRLEGFKHGLQNNGLPAPEEYIQYSDFSDSGGELAATALLNLSDPPTAMVCITDLMAFGVLSALRAHGLVPGEDVSVIGYDGLEFSAHSNPPLTTMAQPLVDAGRRVGEMLLSVIDGEDPKNFQELRRAYLLRRNTDGMVRALPAKKIFHSAEA